MGKKRGREGKHVLLYAAVVALLALSACALPFGGFDSGVCRPQPLRSVRAYLDRGDFDGALRDRQDVLARSPHSREGAEALFDMALLSAHFANPKKDYRRSLDLFRQYIREYPSGPAAEESKIWVGVLESMERAKQVDIEIQEKMKGIAN